MENLVSYQAFPIQIESVRQNISSANFQSDTDLICKKYTSMKTVTITMTKPRSQAQNEIQAQNHNKLARNQVNDN